MDTTKQLDKRIFWSRFWNFTLIPNIYNPILQPREVTLDRKRSFFPVISYKQIPGKGYDNVYKNQRHKKGNFDNSPDHILYFLWIFSLDFSRLNNVKKSAHLNFLSSAGSPQISAPIFR